MKITKKKLKKIIKEEIAKVHLNTSLMEDMFSEEEKHALEEMASFSRIKEKIEQQMIPFVMITAFRGREWDPETKDYKEVSRAKNMKRQKELEMAVKAAGFSWNRMPGSGYVEKPERIPLAYNEVKENSILIWEEGEREDVAKSGTKLKNLATDLAKRFEQDSFIYGEPVTGEATGRTSMLMAPYDQSGNQITETWAGPWSSLAAVGNAAEYWSTIAGKKGQLREMKEEYEKARSGSFMGAVKRQHYIKAATAGLKWIEAKERK
jgi:hypothetical protein